MANPIRKSVANKKVLWLIYFFVRDMKVADVIDVFLFKFPIIDIFTRNVINLYHLSQ